MLVLEPSQDGAAKVARKGCGIFHVRFRGRAAHAGLEPEKGASALAEMARFVLFLEGLAAPAAGTTLTASVARSGGATNVVPEAAELAVDARAWTREETQRVSAAIRGYRAGRPGSERLASRAASTDRPSSPRPPRRPSTQRPGGWPGISASSWVRRGWGAPRTATSPPRPGSRPSTASGPRGGGAHARDEHVLVADLPLRAALVAALADRSPSRGPRAPRSAARAAGASRGAP